MPRLLSRIPERPGPLLWTSLLCLVALLGLAFWVLCAHQVDKADARRVAKRVEQVAFGDCLEFIQGSTIASCRREFVSSSLP